MDQDAAEDCQPLVIPAAGVASWAATADVVVTGYGMAGACAAIAAAEAGADVLVLERLVYLAVRERAADDLHAIALRRDQIDAAVARLAHLGDQLGRLVAGLDRGRIRRDGAADVGDAGRGGRRVGGKLGRPSRAGGEGSQQERAHRGV